MLQMLSIFGHLSGLIADLECVILGLSYSLKEQPVKNTLVLMSLFLLLFSACTPNHVAPDGYTQVGSIENPIDLGDGWKAGIENSGFLYSNRVLVIGKGDNWYSEDRFEFEVPMECQTHNTASLLTQLLPIIEFSVCSADNQVFVKRLK
jgi:hypothetical protein